VGHTGVVQAACDWLGTQKNTPTRVRPEDSKKAEPFLPETVSAYIKKFGLYADKPD